MIGAEVLEGLPLRHLGSKIEIRGDVTSTMDLAWLLASAGAPPGTIVVAETQAKGRGRYGRAWGSPRGGLWLSILLAPYDPSVPPGAIPIAGAIAVALAARELAGVDARIRWPNDVLVGDRKLAGVLAEARRPAGGEERIVLGIGVNVRVRLEDLDPETRPLATSLEALTHREHDLAGVLRAVLVHLDELLSQLHDGNLASVERTWTELSSTLARKVRIETPEGERRGTAVALSIDGGLVLEEESGARRAYRGEHVTRLVEEPW